MPVQVIQYLHTHTYKLNKLINFQHILNLLITNAQQIEILINQM